MTQRKTERAKQLLVRYIRDRQMKCGDKLPSQNELRKTFKFGAATISAAINALKEDGVLDVRSKVGVFVIDPDADGHAGRVIGVAMSHGGNNFYYSSLLTHLQLHLMENGCSVHLFRSSRKKEIDSIFFEIDDFPGLRRSLERQEIQGLIHLDDFSQEALTFIRSRNMPLVFIGSPGGIASNGVVLDHAGVVRSAGCRLREQGALRPALICQKSIRSCVEEAFYENADENSWIFSENKSGAGRVFCREFLAMAERERPDWLIFLDDWLAQSCLAELACELAPDKMPGAVILCNTAADLRFPVRKLIFYDNNLDEFSAAGVRLLMGAVKSGERETGLETYLPCEYKFPL